MLVCLQFESIGRRKRQNGRPWTRQVQCTSASQSLPQCRRWNRIANASRRAQSPSWKTAWAHGSSLTPDD